MQAQIMPLLHFRLDGASRYSFPTDEEHAFMNLLLPTTCTLYHLRHSSVAPLNLGRDLALT